MSGKFDIVVAGGGHNGLVAACYLAKAGMKVCVVEKNDKVGGGVMTREMNVPGFKYDVCSVAHTLLQANPLIRNDELKLKSKYGLKYVNPEKMTSIFFDDGTTLDFYTDLERTAASFAKISPEDADSYYRFNKKVFQNLDLLVTGMFHTPPGYGQQAMAMDQSPEGQELMRAMSISSWDMINEYFKHPKLKIGLARYASEVMFNPFNNGTGFGFFICLPLMHRYGTGVPVGGSGAFADALAACLKDHGGVIMTDSPIKQFKMDGQKAVGVVLDTGDEVLASRAVLSNLHLQQIFPDMVPGATLPENFVERVKTVKFSAFAPFNMNVALREAPKYKVGPAVDNFFWVERCHSDVGEFEQAFYDLEHGIPRRDFVAYVTQDTVDKGTRSPEGTRMLNMYALSTFDLKDGGPERWDEIGREVAYGYLNDLKELTTNITDDTIIDFVWYTPLDIQRHNNSMLRGDILHFGQYAWQLGGNRPLPGWGQYRTPVEQLLMCGASTHPGGGVTGASGRNVARILLEEHGFDFDDVVAR